MIIQFGYMSDGFVIILTLLFVIGLVIQVIVAALIAKDARRRGIDSSMYTFLVCCCFGWFCGGIIYLMVASDHPVKTDNLQQPSFDSNQGQGYGQPQTTYGQPQPTYKRPQDQQPSQPTQPKSAYSDFDTTMTSFETVFCSVCGSKHKKDAKFCANCGADLK